MFFGFVAVQETNRILEHHLLQNQQDESTIMNFHQRLAAEATVRALDSGKVVITGFQSTIQRRRLEFVPMIASVSLVFHQEVLLRSHPVAKFGAHGALFLVVIKVDIAETIDILVSVMAFLLGIKGHG